MSRALSRPGVVDVDIEHVRAVAHLLAARLTMPSQSSPSSSRLNFREPEALHRSPTIRKLVVLAVGDRGEEAGELGATTARGLACAGRESSTSAIAAMCSGVVPQHPPMTLTPWCSTNFRRLSAIGAGPSGYSVSPLLEDREPGVG
jgi:hypothetical protein